MVGTEVQHTFRVTTQVRTTDETTALLLQLLAHRGVAVSSLEGAILSSTVPSVVFGLEKALRSTLDREPMVVGRGLKTGMKVRTDNPREVGADRIVNAVAARHLWPGTALVVVDFGTATTFDCINAKGEYLGGAIAPGFRISEEALYARTAQLPRIEVAQPATAIGRNTVSAMQSGLFFGYVGLTDTLARRCREELGGAKVVATGGLANLLGRASEVIEEVDAHLTLRGLALLAERN